MTQVSFTISNGGAGNTIYMPTDDPSVNQITLLISSDTALTLTAGTPVPEKQAAGATGALFYLNLKNLGLNKTELDGLSVTMDGWTAQVFSDTQVVCLTPASDMPVGVGQVLTARIGNFLASKAPSGASAQLYMNFYRAVPVSSGALPFTYNNIVALQAPPSGQLDLHDVIAVTLSNNTVVQATADYPDVTNSFRLTFGPGSKPKTVKAGPKTQFTVNFVYADDQYGYGALTTIGNAFDIKVNTDAGWGITDPPPASTNPGWMLQPQDGQPILSTGTADFQLSQIVTRFQAGATLMMISYSGVPGYQDGAFTLVIYKEAHVYIHSLLASPNPVVLDKGKATVDLSWTATGDPLTLMPGMIDVSRRSVYQATITQSTQFTLIAQGRSPNNYASSDIQVDIFPVINSIVATPKNIHHKDFPHDVLLDWSVNTNSEIVLSTSISKNVQYYPPNDTTSVSVKQPQMFTIEPYDTGLPLYIERSQVISAFDLARKPVSLSAKPQAVALSPTANICAVAQKDSNQILLLETITNAQYGSPISAGNGPVAIAFARDGQRFFVANGGDSTLSVFNVTFSSASNNFVFTKVTDVTLSGVPVAVAVSADGSSIFVTSNNSNRKPGALDVVTSSDGVNYFVSNSVVFDGEVGTLTVLPSSAQIFVMSSAAQSVYVVGYDSISQSYQWVRTIGGFDAADKPQDLAIAGQDFGTLLIACSGSNVVYAIAKEAQSVSGRQKLKVGSDPRRIIVIESGAYAYVANAGNSTLSLIGCFKGAGLCAVLESGLANGAAPAALTSSAEGSLVYVGNADQSLSVWNIKTFTDDGAVNSATLVTSVAASLQYVVSWHNFNINIQYQGKQATPGLSVYNRSTETTALVNPTTQYLTFEFWPDDSQNIAVATQKDSNTLYVLETAKFTTVSSVPFSGSPTAKAIATTISPFGNMLFVLVAETGSVFNLVAIACDIKQNKYQVVSTVNLFTQQAASSYALAAVSDGSSAYVTNSFGKKLYVVTGGRSGYRLSGTTYDFTYMPRAMSCAPDDTELYVWMNQDSNSAFARFGIAAGVLENFVLPNTTQFQFNAMTIAPDGSRLYVCDSNIGGVRVFSTSAMQNVENISFAAASFPIGVAIAPDGSGLYTANAFSGNVSLGTQLAADTSSDIAAKRTRLGAGAAYVGIFLRDYVGQTPTSNTGSGWTFSPDIVPYGVNPMPNSSVLGQQANYNTDYAQNITLDALNNVYVRGLNTNTGAQKSRIYFYWIISSVVQIPGQWSPYNFTFDKNLQNWLDVTAANQGDIAYSPAPLTWKPSSSNPHYCLVAWVDNSADPTPPDLSQWANFATWDDVGNFIKSHPNMAWRNTNDIVVPGQFMNAQTRVNGPSAGGSVTVGVKMDKVPIDNKGTIQFTLINSNGTISYTSPVHPIDTNTFSQTIQWPANAPDPLLTYTYNPAGGKLQGGEQITAFTAFWPGIALKKFLLLHAPELLIELPRVPGALTSSVLMMLGSVKNNYMGK